MDIKITHKIKAGTSGTICMVDFTYVSFNAAIDNDRGIDSAADLVG